jgi:hypothetical protein
MRKFRLFFIAATLGAAVLICAGGFDPAAARARISLGQCIANYNACVQVCYDAPVPDGIGYCKSGCDANHAACVDMAMGAIATQGSSSKKPPLGIAPPPAGLLESGPGFAPQGPAATGGRRGTPSGGAPSGGAGTLY